MHTDLSSHLHTPACNKLIEELQACHENVSNRDFICREWLLNCEFCFQNAFAKFVGVCNSIDDKVVKCLKGERIARSAANRAKARESQAKYKEKLLQQESN